MATFKTQSFAQRLSSLKTTFSKTIQSSEQLINEMNTDINQKNIQITKLEEEKKVHRITHDIITPQLVPGISQVTEFYSQWCR